MKSVFQCDGTFESELYSIAYQIEEHLLEPLQVRYYHFRDHIACKYLELKLLLIELKLHDFSHLINSIPNVKESFVHLKLSVLDSAYVKRILYNVFKMYRAVLDNLEVFDYLG